MTSFIDAHVHPPVEQFLAGPLSPYVEALRDHLGMALEPQPPEDLAEFYRSRDARALLLGWDSESLTKIRPFGNRDVAELVATAPDVFLGFGAVDPTKGAAAVSSIHEAARLGLLGVSFHPAAQGLGPQDRFTYPVWEAAEGLGLILLVHTGLTRVGMGLPGGGGIQLGPARPIHVDAVAAQFPRLKIVIAHTGDLWLGEALAVARHKENVHLCLAGQTPKTFPPDLIEVITGPLADRCHFGSDYPFGDPDEWLAQWHALAFPDEVSRRVLHDNAAALLRLGQSSED